MSIIDDKAKDYKTTPERLLTKWRFHCEGRIDSQNNILRIGKVTDQDLIFNGVCTLDKVDVTIKRNTRVIHFVHLKELGVYFFTDDLSAFDLIVDGLNGAALEIKFPFPFTYEELILARNAKEFLTHANLRGKLIEDTDSLFEFLYDNVEG